MKVVVKPSKLMTCHAELKFYKMAQICADGRWSDGSGGASVELRLEGTSDKDKNMTFRPTWRV